MEEIKLEDAQDFLNQAYRSMEESNIEEYHKYIKSAFEADPNNPEACIHKYRTDLVISGAENCLETFHSIVKFFIPSIESILKSELDLSEKNSRIMSILAIYDKSHETVQDTIANSRNENEGVIEYDDWKSFWFDSFNRLKDQVENVVPKLLEGNLIAEPIKVVLSKRAIEYRHWFSCYVKLANKSDPWWVTKFIAKIKKLEPDYVSPSFRPFPSNFITKWIAEQMKWGDYNRCEQSLGIGE